MVSLQKGATQQSQSSAIDIEKLQKPEPNLLIKESAPSPLQRLFINQTRWMKATTTGSIQLPLIQTDSGKSISTAKKNILGAFFVAALAVTSGAIGYRVGKGSSNEVPAGASALSDYAQAWLDNGLQHNGDIRSVGYFQDFPLLNVLSQNLSHICKDTGNVPKVAWGTADIDFCIEQGNKTKQGHSLRGFFDAVQYKK